MQRKHIIKSLMHFYYPNIIKFLNELHVVISNELLTLKKRFSWIKIKIVNDVKYLKYYKTYPLFYTAVMYKTKVQFIVYNVHHIIIFARASVVLCHNLIVGLVYRTYPNYVRLQQRQPNVITPCIKLIVHIMKSCTYKPQHLLRKIRKSLLH